MKSFFFIPSNKRKYLDRVNRLQKTELVLELEDGVPVSEIRTAISNITNIKDKSKFWVRPRIDYVFDGTLLLEYLINIGYTNFILPKIEDKNHFYKILPLLLNSNLQVILLIEYPKMLLDANELLSKYHFYGLAFGLHDFAKEFGVKPDVETFLVYAKQILLLAKAYGIKYIDSPSMYISDKHKTEFINQLSVMNRMGADGKLLIHPKQLDWFHQLNIYSEKEILWAKNLKAKVNLYDTGFKATIVDEEIIEKPHINLAIKILEWNEKRK